MTTKETVIRYSENAKYCVDIIQQIFMPNDISSSQRLTHARAKGLLDGNNTIYDGLPSHYAGILASWNYSIEEIAQYNEGFEEAYALKIYRLEIISKFGYKAWDRLENIKAILAD